MSRNTSHEVRLAAREMRKNPTPAEKALWRVLRNRAVKGLRFRRQRTLDGLVLDFYCPKCGCAWNSTAMSTTRRSSRSAMPRTAHLQARDIRVLRFRNEEVLSDMRSVLTRIAKPAAEPVRAGQGPREAAHG